MAVTPDSLTGGRARTRAAILAATAVAIAADRRATLPDIARLAEVGRATVHRYFADRETLLREATIDSMRALDVSVTNAAVNDGSALEAMRRVIVAMVGIADRIVFLFGDIRTLELMPPTARPPEHDVLVSSLIERGQREGTLQSGMSPIWIKHALWALVLRGCQDAQSGELSSHLVADTVMQTFERGVGVD